MTDILAAIDAAVGCQQCGGTFGQSPSDDFCDDACQKAWHAERAEQLDGYREPWDDYELPGVGTEGYRPAHPNADLLAADWREVHRAMSELTGEAAERYRSAMAPLGPLLADFVRQFRETLAAWALPITDPTGLTAVAEATVEQRPDPRAAALAARRNRNTGPPLRSRPPRTIGRPSTTRHR